jgi:hypothetical protein
MTNVALGEQRLVRLDPARKLAQCSLIAFEGAMVYAKGRRSAQAFELAQRMVVAMLHNR